MMSPQLFKRLHLKLEKTSKVVKAANGAKFSVLGNLTDIPISSEIIESGLHFVVLKNFPFDLVIWHQTTKRLGGFSILGQERFALHIVISRTFFPAF